MDVSYGVQEAQVVVVGACSPSPTDSEMDRKLRGVDHRLRGDQSPSSWIASTVSSHDSWSRLHHLTTAVVDKYTTTCAQKLEPTVFIPKSASWVSVPFPEATGRLSDDLNSSSRNTGVSYSIQAATQAREHKLHFIIILGLLEKEAKISQTWIIPLCQSQICR